METVRLGIIGMGNMGQDHARRILKGDIKGLRLSAVCDILPARLEPYPEQQSFTEAAALIASPEVDAVLICTPHYDHTTYGIATLKAGKHLLVEKPISVHKADAERLIAAHTNPKQVFAAMFNQRTDPNYIRLKKLISDGELGEIRRVVWVITTWFRTQSYYNSGGWRATWSGEGGGVLLNQCPHQLDLWTWLFGMPETLRADCQIGRYHDIEVEDDVTCTMTYANGCKGLFVTSTGEAPGTNRLEITAERGKVVIEPGVTNGLRWTYNEEPMSAFCQSHPGGFTQPPTREIHIPISTSGPQHNGILENFTQAILKGEPLIAPAAEGLRSVELANAMLYSGFTQNAVRLPLDAALYEATLREKRAHSRYQKPVVTDRLNPDFK